MNNEYQLSGKNYKLSIEIFFTFYLFFEKIFKFLEKL